MKKKFKKFIKFLRSNSLDLIIQMHNFPDPDSIASAFSLKKIFENYSINVKLYYYGSQIGLINKMLLDVSTKIFEGNIFKNNKCKIFFNPEDIHENDYKKKVVFCVDGSPENSNFQKLPLTYIGFIDHHKNYFQNNEKKLASLKKKINLIKKVRNIDKKNYEENNFFISQNFSHYKFVVIGFNYGATSTIIYKLSKKLKVKLDQNLLLLIALGIYTDTNGLKRNVTKEDFLYFYEIYYQIDREKFLFFSENWFAKDEIFYIIEALKNLKIENNIARTYIKGNINPNLLGILADFLLKIIEINFIIIFGIGDNLIYFSTRSIDQNLNCLEFINKNFGDLVSFGGHDEMAAGIFKDNSSIEKVKEFLK